MDDVRKILTDNGLKITIQRVVVLDAIRKLNHPHADDIIRLVQKEHPSISKGTVYNILDLLCGLGVVKKVKTEDDKMRYDAVIKPHHHIFNLVNDEISDYEDEDLDELLRDYFTKNKLKGLEINDIKLNITVKPGKRKLS